MRRSNRLDDVDKEILKLVTKYPKITQSELAKNIGITQPAISLRLRKLRRLQVLTDNVTIDPNSLGIRMMHIDVYTSNPNEIFDKIKKCPMIVNCYSLEGNIVSMVAMGEDKRFLNCMLFKHLKTIKSISKIESKAIIENIKGINSSVELTQHSEFTPCGDGSCKECEYYVDNGGECVGCPLTVHYKGMLWNKSNISMQSIKKY